MELTSQTAVWYRSSKPPVTIRWVLITPRAPSTALLCTDPAADPIQIAHPNTHPYSYGNPESHCDFDPCALVNAAVRAYLQELPVARDHHSASRIPSPTPLENAQSLAGRNPAADGDPHNGTIVYPDRTNSRADGNRHRGGDAHSHNGPRADVALRRPPRRPRSVEYRLAHRPPQHSATPSPTATSTPAPTQPSAQPSDLWRGITIAHREQVLALGLRRIPLFAVSRTSHRRGPGRHLRALHGDLVREHQGNRHRAHRRPLRGPRQRPLCRQPSNLVGVRIRPPEPHAGISQRQPTPEERQRRCRVAPWPEPVLVRRPNPAVTSRIRAHDRPRRG